MLKDELQAIRCLIECREPATHNADISGLNKVILNAWSSAGFSDAPEHTLARYLNFHLSEISKLSDSLEHQEIHPLKNELQQQLLSLLDHLITQYQKYLDLHITAPVAIQRRFLEQLNLKLSGIKKSLSGQIASWILNFLTSGSGNSRTFLNLRYHDELLSALIDLPDKSEPGLIFCLVKMNFNHLSLYNLIANSLAGSPVTELRRKRAEIKAIPVKLDSVYDPCWISLKEMLVAWLDEEILLSENMEATIGRPTEKLYLDISVAHFACFVRLLYEEGLMATAALTTVFRVMSVNFRTKRQPAISEGSFSKEFYSIDQHTAAKVRDMLQRMLSRVNRKYFPVLIALAIDAGHCALLNN